MRVKTILTTAILLIVVLSTTTNAKSQLEPKIKEIKFSIPNPVEGEEILINATISTNISIDNITVLFLCDDYPIGAETINLTPGENSVAIKWKAIAWEHDIKVQLTIDGNIIPNSTVTEKIYVQPKKIGSSVNIVIALIITILVVVAVAAAPAIGEWLKWKKR